MTDLLSRDVRILLAERAMVRATKYKGLGDRFMAKGKELKADRAFAMAERSLLRFRLIVSML